jgi:hypothetical protein
MENTESPALEWIDDFLPATAGMDFAEILPPRPAGSLRVDHGHGNFPKNSFLGLFKLLSYSGLRNFGSSGTCRRATSEFGFSANPVRRSSAFAMPMV